MPLLTDKIVAQVLASLAPKHAGISERTGITGICLEWEGAGSLIRCGTDPQEGFVG